MSEASQNDLAPIAQMPFRPCELPCQLGVIATTDIFEFAPFEQIPDLLFGIEVGGIERRAVPDGYVCRSVRQEVLDRLAAMNGRAIPDDQEFPGNFA